jgi:hypothetical protein
MRFFLLTRREKFDVPWSRVTNRKCLLILVILYFSVALTTFLVWSFRGVNQITGDEPPFLVMTSGLVRHGTFEQTLAYADQAKTHEIYDALCPETRIVGLGQGGQHTVRGPHGLYSKHGIGLPLLLAIPFALYGVLGARIFMIILGSGIVITSWKISGLFSETRITRFLSVLAAAIGMPLLPGSNQIYTDIPAGLIALVGIYWFMTLERQNRLLGYFLVATTLALLPWLHVRYTATAAILFIAIIWKILRTKSRSVRTRAATLMIAFLASSISGVIAYNLYAFGNAPGPFNAELEISKTSLMVLFGLFADQNQGFLLQNPVMLVGLLFAGSLFAADRKLFALWSLVFLSLIVPNSLESAWYGGGSFSGRFQWAAAMVFLIPTIFGLNMLSLKTPKAFHTTVAIGMLVQACYFWQYARGYVFLYNRSASTLPEDYTIFHRHMHIYQWLPMLYNEHVAFKYLPNIAWLIALSTLAVAGFVLGNRPSFPSVKLLCGLGAFCFLLIIPSGSMVKAYGSRAPARNEATRLAVSQRAQAG